MKRGQISLFVILGIVIVSIVGAGLYFRNTLQEKSVGDYAEKITVAPEVQNIYDHVFDCIDHTAKDAIIYIGTQGGYYLPPDGSIEIIGENVAIGLGYDVGENVLPSLKVIEDEIALYVNAFTPLCVDLTQFESFEFEESFPKTQVHINDEMVRLEVDYDIVAKKEENVYKLDETYNLGYPVRLKKMHEISKRIIENSMENPSVLDRIFLLDLGVSIDVLPYDEKNIVYSLTDGESEVKDLPYIFMFGGRFEK